MLQGMKEPYGKGSSESILASSLAWDAVRCFVKCPESIIDRIRRLL
jgi:hypothetical protein